MCRKCFIITWPAINWNYIQKRRSDTLLTGLKCCIYVTWRPGDLGFISILWNNQEWTSCNRTRAPAAPAFLSCRREYRIENHCLPLLQCLQSATWIDWLNMSQSAADLSCLNAQHDEAQPLNTLAGFRCVSVPNESVGLPSLLLLFSASFYVFLSIKALSHSLCFLSLLGHSSWWKPPGGWGFFVPLFKRNLHVLKSIPNLFLAHSKWVSRSPPHPAPVCGISFVCDTQKARECY